MSVVKEKALNEISGLATSLKTADTIYLCNDEPGKIYAVNPKTGATVGSFTLSGYTLSDPESMAVDGCGNLWIWDGGDNDGVRTTKYLYKLPEPGRGHHGALHATRYPVQYSDGKKHNSEALIINPLTNEMHIFTKTEGHGLVFVLNKTLNSGSVNIAKRVSGKQVPSNVSDACWTRSAKKILVRSADNPTTVVVLTKTFGYAGKIGVPKQPKPESIDVDRGGTNFYIATEIKHFNSANTLYTEKLDVKFR